MPESSENGTYYDVLHVSRDAPVEIIRGSYRTLMQKLGNHPDLGGDTARAALINEAYAVLSNPERRAEYDAGLAVMDAVTERTSGPQAEVRASRHATQKPDPGRQCAFCGRPHHHGRVTDPDVSCENCKSPLCAVENLDIDSSDQRAIVRIRKRHRVAFFTAWPQERSFVGRTEDLSPNGLCLVTSQWVAEGRCIKLASPVVEATGRIVRVVPRRRGWHTEYLLGISFVTLRFVRSTGGLLSTRI